MLIKVMESKMALVMPVLLFLVGLGALIWTDIHKLENDANYLAQRAKECPEILLEPGDILTDPLTGSPIEVLHYGQYIGTISTSISRSDPCNKFALVRYQNGNTAEVDYRTISRWISKSSLEEADHW